VKRGLPASVRDADRAGSIPGARSSRPRTSRTRPARATDPNHLAATSTSRVTQPPAEWRRLRACNGAHDAARAEVRAVHGAATTAAGGRLCLTTGLLRPGQQGRSAARSGCARTPRGPSPTARAWTSPPGPRRHRSRPTAPRARPTPPSSPRRGDACSAGTLRGSRCGGLLHPISPGETKQTAAVSLG